MSIKTINGKCPHCWNNLEVESAPPAGSTAEEIEDAAYRLAMLGLQSDRYSLDRDFSDAVDDVLNMIQQKVMSR